MAKIKKGVITGIGSCKNFSWQDSLTVDRSCVDDEMVGEPVIMKKEGSGSFELTDGQIASGYHADLVLTASVGSVAAGTETETSRVFTFDAVTVENGGNVENDGVGGSIKVNFAYGECTPS